MSGELLWRSLPPLTFSTRGFILAALTEPCYDVGGDAFDYAVDDDLARVGIFDAVGHDLSATVTAVLTLAAIRAARARGDGLLEPGARLVFYTDGVVEARDESGGRFGPHRLVDLSSGTRQPGCRHPRRCAGCGMLSSLTTTAHARTTPP